MRKKLLPIIIALFALCGTKAFATDYDLWVAGVQVTSNNASNITGTGITGSVSYNASSNTLTLSGASITASGSGNYGIESLIPGLKIQLTGSNAISTYSYGIRSQADMTVQGPGTLNVTATNSSSYDAIYATGNLTFSNCTVEARSNNGNGISGTSGKTLTVNGGSLTAEGRGTNKYPISGFGHLSMTGVSITYPANIHYDEDSKRLENASGYAITGEAVIESINHSLWVAGHKLGGGNSGTGTYTFTGEGITGSVAYNFGTNTLSLSGASITASGSGNYGIESLIPGLKIQLTGSNAISTYSYGIRSQADMTVQGPGTLNVTATNSSSYDAIYATGNLTFSNCTVEARSNNGNGISGTSEKTLTVNGGSLTAEGRGTNKYPISGFGHLSMVDGINISYPENASYDETDRRIEYASGSAVTGEAVIESVAHSLWVAGHKLEGESGTYTFTGEGISGSVSYSYSTNTLSLSGASITASGNSNYGIKSLIPGLKIQLTGSNSISTSSYGIYSQADMTIQGTGTLNVTGSTAIKVTDDLTLSNCTVEARGSGSYSVGISGTSGKTLTVNGGSLSAIGGTNAYPINGFGHLSMTGVSITYPANVHYDEDSKRLEDASGSAVTGEAFIESVNHSLWVAGHKLGGGNSGTYTFTGTGISGSVYYNFSSNTLTLNKANIVGGITNYLPDLTILLVDGNVLTNNGDCCLYNDVSKLTITGTGSLSTSSYNQACIIVSGNLYIQGGCTIHVSAPLKNSFEKAGLRGSAGKTLSINNSTVIAEGYDEENGAISGFSNVSLTGISVTNPSGASYNTTDCCYENNGTLVKHIEIGDTSRCLWVAGQKPPQGSSNYTFTGPGITGSVTYNALSNTLSLSDADIIATIEGIKNYIPGLTIYLQGESTIHSTDYYYSPGIHSVHGDLTFKGSGTLNVSSSSADGIRVNEGDMYLQDGCYVSANGPDAASSFEGAGVLGSAGKRLYINNASLDAQGFHSSFGSIGGFEWVDITDAIMWSPQDATYNSIHHCYRDTAGNVVTEQISIETVNHSLWVSGDKLKGSGTYTFTLSNSFSSGSAVYDFSTNTLTLTNATIYGGFDYGAIRSYISGLKIALVGQNKLVGGFSQIPLYSDHSFTIQGQGSLVVTTYTGSGIVVENGGLTIEGGCSVSSSALGTAQNSKGSGVLGMGWPLTIKGSSLHAVGNDETHGSIGGFGNVILENGSILTSPQGAIYDTERWCYVTGSGEVVTSQIDIESSIDYDLTVRNVRVCSSNINDVLGDGTVSYDVVTNTLTLHNANIDAVTGINNNIQNLTINLEGSNTINASSRGIRSEKDFRITGTGSLNVEGDNAGISAVECNLTIEGDCAVYSHGLSSSAYTLGIGGSEGYDLTINGATVWAQSAGISTCSSIFGFSHLVLNNCRIYDPMMAVWSEENRRIEVNGNAFNDMVQIGNIYLRIANVNVTNANASNITGEGITGHVSYDPETNKLTLENANITIEGNAIRNYMEGLTINLVGQNIVDGGNFTTINSHKSMTITGFGSLLVYSGNSNISVTDDLTLEGGCYVKTYSNGSNVVLGLSIGGLLTIDESYLRIQSVSQNHNGLWCNDLNLVNSSIIHPSSNANFQNNTIYYNGSEYQGEIIIEPDVYKLWIGDTRVTRDNASDVLGNGTVFYNPTEQRLTLNSAYIIGHNGDGINNQLPYELYVTINGASRVESQNSYGITSQNGLIIQGPNSLYVTGTTGICVGNDRFEDTYGGTVIARGTGLGEFNAGIWCNPNVYVVVSQATLKAECPSANYGAIRADNIALIGATIISPSGAHIDPVTHRMVYANGNVLNDAQVIIEPDPFDLWVAGTRVTVGNKNDVLGDGTVSFNQTTTTLTLNNANIETETIGIESRIFGLTIQLNGENRIVSRNSDGIEYGKSLWSSSETLTIKGAGSLYVEGKSYGMMGYSNLLIKDGCTVDVVSNGPSHYAAISSFDFSSSLTVNASTLAVRADYTTVGVINGFANLNCQGGSSLIYPTGANYANNRLVVDNEPLSGMALIDHNSYNLKVANTIVNYLNKDDVLGDGTVSFNPTTHTLTLNNAHIFNSNDDGIQTSHDGLIIHLVGNNNIQAGDDGIQITNASTTITGPGKLTLNTNYGIYSPQGGSHLLSFTDNCDVTINANYFGISIIDPIYVGFAVLRSKGGTNSVSLKCPGLTMDDQVSIIAPEDTYFGYSPNNGAYGVCFSSTNDLVKGEMVVIGPEPYNLWVADTQVSPVNSNDVLADGGSVSYDANTNVLTLNNATITNASYGILNSIDDLTIQLVGTSNINGSYGILSEEDFTIKGNSYSTLNLSGSSGIVANFCDMAIEGGCNVNVTATEDHGIRSTGTGHYLDIINSKVTLEGSDGNYPVNNIQPRLTGCSITTPTNAVWNSEGRYYTVGGSPYIGQMVISPLSYNLIVAGKQVTTANANDVLGNGTVYYDAGNNVLTLDNAYINYNDYTGVPNGRGMLFNGINNLTISLVGTNTIVHTLNGIVLSAANTYITGPGSLTMEGARNFYGSTSTVENLTIKDNAHLYLNGITSAILVPYAKLTINSSEIHAVVETNSPIRSKQIDLQRVVVTQPDDAEWNTSGYFVDSNGTTITGEIVIDGIPYGLYVNEEEVTSTNCMNFTYGVESGHVSFDPDDNTLTLDHAVTRTMGLGSPAIRNEGLATLNIKLIGDNYLSGDGTDGNYALQNEVQNCDINIFGNEEGETDRLMSMGPLNFVKNNRLTVSDGCIVELYDDGSNQNGYVSGGTNFELWVDNAALKARRIFNLYDLAQGDVIEPAGAQLNNSTHNIEVNGQEASDIFIGNYLGLRIADVYVNSYNCHNIISDYITSGTVSYDPFTMTLTLNDVNLEYNIGSAINREYTSSAEYDAEPLYINVVGNNTILSENDGMYIETGGIVFEGTGTLDITGYVGILTEGSDITLEPYVTLIARSNSASHCAISNYGGLLSVPFDATLWAVPNGAGNLSPINGFDEIALYGSVIRFPEGAVYDTHDKRMEDAEGNPIDGNVLIQGQSFNLWVGEEQVSTANYTDVLGDGTVSYDPTTNTLTLNGADIDGNPDDGMGIKSYINNLTINLVGTNYIWSDDEGLSLFGDNLVVSGTGILFILSNWGITGHNDDLGYYPSVTVEGGCSVTTYFQSGFTGSSVTGGAVMLGTWSDAGTFTIDGSSFDAIDEDGLAACIFAQSLNLIGTSISTPTNGYINGSQVYDSNGNLSDEISINPTNYDLWVGGVHVTGTNANNITGPKITSGLVSYDAITNTLTLDGATIGGSVESGGGIASRIEDLNIVLVGENTINFTHNYGINIRENTTISGSGTLNINAGYGVHGEINEQNIYPSMAIVGGCMLNVNATDGEAVNLHDGVFSIDASSFIAQPNRNGKALVYCGSLVMNEVDFVAPEHGKFINGKIKNANNQDPDLISISVVSYNLRIAGTQVTSQNANNITGPGITSGTVSYDAASNTLTLRNAEITASGEAIENGIPNLSIVVEGVSNLSSSNYGVRSYANFSIEGDGVLNIISDNNGIRADGSSLTISGGCLVHTYHFGSGSYPGVFIAYTLTVDCSTLIIDPIDEICPLVCGGYAFEDVDFSQPVQATLGSDGRIYSNGTLYTGQIVIEPIQYNLRVAGIQVTTANASNITGPGITSGMVSYDAASNTLTLRDAEITASAEAVENGIPNLGIVVEGVSNLSSDNYGVRSYDNFSIEGGGVLNIWSENNGIRADNSSLTISGGCTVHTYHVGSGLYPALAVSFTLTVDGSTLILDPIDDDYICPMSCGSYELVGVEFSQPVQASLEPDSRIYSNGTLYTGQIVIEPIKYDLWVAGTQVTAINASNVLGDGKVSYNASTQTLTLNNANIVYTDGEINESNGIYNAGIDGLKITLEGENSITAGDAGILTDVETEITGIGTLDISAPWGIYGDWSDSKLTLSEGCMVQVEASTLGVDVVSLTVDKSTLVASGNSGSVRTDDLDLVGASIYLPEQAEWDGEGNGYVIENGYPVTSQVAISILQYDLWVADTRVNAINAANILGEGIISGSVSYDEVTNTLTLDNAYIVYEVEGDGNYLGGIITKCDNLTINLVGNNTIYTDSSDDSDNGILIYGTNTTFTGQGTLDIGSSHGIWCFHNNLDDTRTFNLTFSGGCDVEVYQSDCGIYLNDLGKLNVDHSSLSVIWPTTCGIYLEQEPELVGTEILFPRGGYWNGHQIVDPNGSATQSVTIKPCNVFLGTIDSSWDVEGNWSNDILPDIYSKVHIAAPCVSDDDIQVREIVIDDSGSLNLVNDAVLTVDNIVNDDPAKFVITYGQLYCDNEVVGTFHKNITMAGSDATGWYTIAVPMNNPSIVHLTDNTYDLYAYDEDADQNEWQNYKDNPFSLVSGHGYLYANSATTDLVMTGTFRPSNRMLTKPLSYGAQYEGIRGFNLIGNPFPHNITMINVKVNGEPIIEFYILNNSGELQLFNQGDDVILPGQGFFIKATGPNQKVTIEGE